MSITVGIPRALLYYHYYPAWEVFFTTLGAKVVLSNETTKTILDQGIRFGVEEACLPVKLFLGHAANLRDQGVDTIFIPRVVSLEAHKFLCPKFLGLPEIARFCIPNLPELLDLEINVQQRPRQTERGLRQLAARFDRRPWMIKRALQAAIAAQADYEHRMQQGCTHAEALANKQSLLDPTKARVAVLGHAYNLNDSFISLNLVGKLRELGVEIMTSEMITPQAINKGAACLSKASFWTFGHELLGAGCHLLEENSIAGLILVVSFGCGPDSLICELVERFYKRQHSIPVLMLTLDEHTGEAGVVTRLEAFVDMLRWREAI